jgi:carbonic anhydrase
MTSPAFRRFALVFGLLVVVAVTLASSFAQEHAKPHWSYGGSDGPDHWGELDSAFKACLAGHMQSPIDIRDATVRELAPIQFAYRRTPLHIVNNGHTIQVQYAPGSFISVGDKRYELKQFHFHHPSEERINGQGFEMVAHLVHAASDGALAVVAVLLDVGAANPVLASVWRHLPAHEGPEMKHDDVQIDVTGLLPRNRGYYTFTGSLTTPPCTEGVTWFVLKTPESISRDQADAFGRIYPSDARPVQPTYGRVVLASK